MRGVNRLRIYLARVQKAFSHFSPYQPFKGGQGHLDEQYQTGEWDYLRAAPEAPRFGVVSAYCKQFADGGDLLEIGCGEGILFEHLNRARIGSFVGVDISPVAIARTKPLQDAQVTFEVAQAEAFVAHKTFDVIVFNEVMEYFADPVGVARRYDAMLKPNGVFVISMFDGLDVARAKRIWKALTPHYEVVAGAGVTTVPGYLWRIKVLKPRGAGQ